MKSLYDMSMKNASAYLIVALAPLCWAGDIVLAKGISQSVPPFSLAFWRWTIAFFILMPFAWNHVKKDWLIAKKSYQIILLLSVLGISGFITLIYTAVHTTTAINSALIQTTMPALIVIFCLILYGETISVAQIAGLSMCFAGACYVVLQGNITHVLDTSFVKGDVLMIVASILYGLYSALLPKVPIMHPLSFLTFVSGAGALGLLPVYIYELIIEGAFKVNAKSILGILYVALFPSIIAYLCWNKGVATLGANKTGMFVYLIPIFASIMAIVFLGESIRSFHIVGLAMILVGIIIFNKFSKIQAGV